MNSVLSETALNPLLEEALPAGVLDKLRAIYQYMDSSILYPLRMAEDKDEAEQQLSRLLPEYQQLRGTVNLLLLDELGKGGLENVYGGVRQELEEFNGPANLSTPNTKLSLQQSLQKAFDLSHLIMEAVSNTPEINDQDNSLSALPDKRLEYFEQLTDLIGEWELAASAAVSALVQKQGKREVVTHLVDLAEEAIGEAEEQAGKVIRNCTNCGKPFIMRRTNQKYCSKNCLSKARNRRYRQSQKESQTS